jgi:hypothetical protein
MKYLIAIVPCLTFLFLSFITKPALAATSTIQCSSTIDDTIVMITIDTNSNIANFQEYYFETRKSAMGVPCEVAQAPLSFTCLADHQNPNIIFNGWLEQSSTKVTVDGSEVTGTFDGGTGHGPQSLTCNLNP